MFFNVDRIDDVEENRFLIKKKLIEFCILVYFEIEITVFFVLYFFPKSKYITMTTFAFLLRTKKKLC